MEKQHNRGQDGAGIACVKFDMPPGDPFLERERTAKRNPIERLFDEALSPAREMDEQELLSLDETKLKKRFPLLAQSRMLELELHAGQMLYLPAGWFHEVSSDGGGAGDGLHCALNYWYHPPKLGTPYERPHGRDGQPFWESRMPRPPPQS
jgi:hypothetical protein